MKLSPGCWLPFLTALALLLCRGAAAESAAPLNLHLGPTVEITRSHSWCWFPTVHRFRSGEILVSMVLSPDQVNSESAVSAFCLSRDGGQTWSRRWGVTRNPWNPRYTCSGSSGGSAAVLAAGLAPLSKAMAFDRASSGDIILIPRNKPDAPVVSIPAPARFAFHMANAFEDSATGEVVFEMGEAEVRI